MQIYMNDSLGCCTVAAKAHEQGVWSGNANDGQCVMWSDDDIVGMYSACGGYVPGNPSTDQGCDPVTVLNYCVNTGFPDGSKATGWVQVDATNVVLVQTAIFALETVDICVELPDSWITPFPQGDGFTWGVDPNGPDPSNGHCFMAAGYDANGVKIDTWALEGTLTYAALAAYCVESAGGGLYVLLSSEMIAAGQTAAPNGIDWTSLQADLAAL